MADAPRFAILRTQKLKHLASVRRSLKHSFREQETPNADPSREHENTHLGADSAAEAMAAVQARLPEKRRKDAVLAIEYLITASPEAMQGKSRIEQDSYFMDALTWIRERHGTDNVVYAGIHRDETTPHLYAYAVPLDPDTGRLNAKRWLGGSRALSQMQSEFADKVGQRHGLERGIEGSKARHQTIKQYYSRVASAEKTPVITAQDLEPQAFKEGLLGKLGVKTHKETPVGVAQRLNQKVEVVAAKAAESAENARRAAEAQKTMAAQQKRLKPLLDAFRPLNVDKHPDLLAIVKAGSAKLVSQQEQEAQRAKEEKERKAAEREQQRQQRRKQRARTRPRSFRDLGR